MRTCLLRPLVFPCLRRAVQSAGPEFQAAADLLASCLTAAADCIERGAPYADALGALWEQLFCLFLFCSALPPVCH